MLFLPPKQLQRLCQEYGIKPSKSYGQNYLVDPLPIEAMVAAGELKKTDTVVEIGPGFGVLTLALAPEVKKVISFEIEKKLTKYWQEQFEENEIKNLEIIWGDVLQQFPKLETSKLDNYKVIANLPYQITSPIIRMFLETKNPPQIMIFMVQKEVAERICAKPGDMSLLAISVQYYADAEVILNVPRILFWPAPEVDSAVIAIKTVKNQEKKKISDNDFFKLVRAGFAQKRKLLIKNLLPYYNKEKLNQAFTELGLKPTARAQELSVSDWQRLSTYLYN